MKTKLMTLFILILVQKSFAQPSGNTFRYFFANEIPEETSNDFIELLNKSTGANWQKTDQPGRVDKGVVLTIMNDPRFTTKESFRIQSDGNRKLNITSSSSEGLIFGMYKYLRSIGFGFFLPGDLYAVIPSISAPFGKKRDEYDKPFLQVRNFTGTGGFGSTNPDSQKIVEKDWQKWKLRNGFGSAYSLAGHRGENFILENFETLRKNPDWLATPLGATAQASGNTKLNYLNKAAVDFYADWSIKPFTQPGFALPPKNITEFVSVEPSDGGGYLNELPQHANKNLPSISDQVYLMANLAAQKLEKKFPSNPNLGVNLYAYSSHAAPPEFTLHPRVFVQLVPYQFQNVAYGPSFIKLWAKKAKRFGLYDYLNYPDAQYDLPGGLTIDEAMKRLVHSVRNGSEGTTYESSFSKFATGIPLWLLGRYMADGDADWSKNLKQLSQQLYGSGSEKLEALFRLFYTDAFSEQNLGAALNLVSDGEQQATDPEVKKRIEEIKLYLQYVDLVYQSRDVSKGSLSQRLIPVAEFAWKVFPTKIIHSYRIMQLVSYSFLNSDRSDKDWNLHQQLHLDWFPETERSKTAWARITQGLSTSQINSGFSALQKKYSSAVAKTSYAVNDAASVLKAPLTAKRSVVFGSDASVRGYFSVYTPKASAIDVRYSITGPKPMLTISGIDGGYVADTAIILNKTSGTFRMKLNAGETNFFLNAGEGTSYRIQADITDGYFFFDGSPRGKLAFYKSFNDAADQFTYQADVYPSYIFIPKSTNAVDYKVQINALNISTTSGKRINPSLVLTDASGFETRRFTVPPSEAGKFWKAEISGNYNYQFLNIPDRYFLLQKK